MIIGTFTKNDQGGYHGQIDTAGLQLTDVVFEATEKGANFAISAANGSRCFEVGAAWKKTGEYGDYLSVKIDSPILPAPINATMKLAASENGSHALRWNRPKSED